MDSEGIDHKHRRNINLRNSLKLQMKAPFGQGTPLDMDIGIDRCLPRVLKHTYPDGRTEYAIHDVYFRGDGSIYGYSRFARSIRTSTVAELKQWILQNLDTQASETRLTCGDQNKPAMGADFRLWLRHLELSPLELKLLA